MAFRVGNRLILPIGCSCIVQFQLQKSTRLRSLLATGGVSGGAEGGLFDWQITKPRSTAEILSAGNTCIEGPADFEIHARRVRLRRFPGIYFWHMNKDIGKDAPEIDGIEELQPNFPAIRDKYNHLLGKLRHQEREVHCIWSNIQPNLLPAVGKVRQPWSDYVLDIERYDDLRRASELIEADEVRTYFVCREEDVDRRLLSRDDVVVLELPRSPDYQGEADLFDPVVERILMSGRGSPV